jgi:ABC-2 type transport system ATP-binding protein
MLLDLVRPDAGTATLFGLDSVADGPKVRANIGYVPETHEWGYPAMTVGQLLAHHATYFTAWDHAYAQRLVGLFEIDTTRKLAQLSKGQSRRVHLTMAMAHRPALLLLDEPIDGLDPIMRDETLGAMAEHLSETPTTMVISTHHVSEVEGMADYIGAMRSGELKTQLPLAQLQKHLLRYRADVPDGWSGIPGLNGSVLRRAGGARDVQWTIWGAEAEVTAQFAGAGATVRDVARLTLQEATLALLNPKAEGV